MTKNNQVNLIHTKKHYFIEFVIILFTVFIGSFAAYFTDGVRDNNNKRKLGEDYIKILVEDLKKDTSYIKNIQKRRIERIQKCDIVFSLLNRLNNLKSMDSLYSTVQLLSFSPFTPNDGALQQLISSGNLGLIGDIKLVEKILEYETQLRRISFIQIKYERSQEDLQKSIRKIFKNNVFYTSDSLYKTVSVYSESEYRDYGMDTILFIGSKAVKGNPNLFLKDSLELNILVGNLRHYKWMYIYLANILQKLYNLEIEIINHGGLYLKDKT